ncbi:MAG: 2-phosphosulfolactate phosphatase, partial [Candidatus Hydrogenedentes bacterium]|nr:2-phosphosulfolactate phosphatase [Candidatus Hydrogenedentota bacterium]
VPLLFATAPHAEKLRRLGLERDIAFCAQVDITSAVPRGLRREDSGVVVRNSAC